MPPLLDDPKVTVIIPVYNSAATLARAARSVLLQTLKELELLIVDDGSTDRSFAVASAIAATEARVHVLQMPSNAGKPAAMNHAISLARGRWIAVLDADDRYLPERLATLIEAGEASGADLVADNQRHVDPATGALVRSAFNQPGDGRAVDLADFIANSGIRGTFDFGILKPVVRAEFIARTGLAYHREARLAEDFYYLLEFFAAGGKGWIVHEPLYEWTLPFSPSARQWTETGAGQWRYDYTTALAVNRHFCDVYESRPEILSLLQRRERDYFMMMHYLNAQRALAQGKAVRALALVAAHPSTWTLLVQRVIGRARRALRGAAVESSGTA
jgi:succinoglycan biosynthesis protein ExoO